jgi:chromosome partitioning protein
MIQNMKRTAPSKKAAVAVAVENVTRSMKTLVVANQKGGAGKSSVCTHLAYAAIEGGLRVLIVDLDPQASLSLGFPATGLHQGEASTSLDLFAEGSHIVPEQLNENLFILRSHKKLEMLSGEDPAVAKRPRRYLRELAGQYDLCVIDTPGVLGFNPPMTVAGLIAADAVLCPFQVGLYEEAALRNLLEYLGAVRSGGYNPRLRIMGLLPSKISPVGKRQIQQVEDLRKTFKDGILPLTLFERVSVRDAISDRKPVWRGTKGAGHAKAGKEWKTVMHYALTNLGVLK